MIKKVLIVVVILLVGLRMILPGLILPPLNKKLATISPAVHVHIDDLDFGLLMGRYRFEGLKIRSQGRPDSKGFLRIDAATISLAWRELFRGRILADVQLEGLDVLIGPELAEVQKTLAAAKTDEDTKDLAGTLVPFNVDRVLVTNSRLGFENDFIGEEGRLLFTNLNGRISNLSNKPNSTLPSLISLKADMLGTAAVTVTGKAQPFRVPVDWDLRIKAVGFDLTKANTLLKKTLPLTFTRGSLDVFSELKSEDKVITGYVKPFFEDLDVIARKEKFLGAKHFGIEVASAFGNLLMRESSKKTTAAILDFSYGPNGADYKIGKMLTSALRNGFVEPLNKDFENREQLSEPGAVN